MSNNDPIGTVLVTGGNRGIGKAIALTLAKSRYNITFTYNSGTKEAISTEREIMELGVDVKSYQVDLASAERLEYFTRKVNENGKRIFAIINNAGIYRGDTLNEISNEEWEKTIGLNLTAPFYLVRDLHNIIEDGGASLCILQENVPLRSCDGHNGSEGEGENVLHFNLLQHDVGKIS